MEERTSVSPDGTTYALPQQDDYPAELARIVGRDLLDAHLVNRVGRGVDENGRWTA